jgi:hypothetical protein
MMKRSTDLFPLAAASLWRVWRWRTARVVGDPDSETACGTLPQNRSAFGWRVVIRYFFVRLLTRNSMACERSSATGFLPDVEGRRTDRVRLLKRIGRLCSRQSAEPSRKTSRRLSQNERRRAPSTQGHWRKRRVLRRGLQAKPKTAFVTVNQLC